MPSTQQCRKTFTCGFVSKIGVCSASFVFPAPPKFAIKVHCPEAKTLQIPFGKQSRKREYRLSAVPTDQTGRIVARPHRAYPPLLR